jgi:hypothetical protein
MPRRASLAALLLLASSACVSVTGPKAIRPGTSSFGGNLDVVDSLTPLLQWEPEAEATPATPPAPRTDPAAPAQAATAAEIEPRACWDVAVHEIVFEPERMRTIERRQAGARAYYRECVATTRHRLEHALLPGRDYYWFVRTRRGDAVGPWSEYKYVFFAVVTGFLGSGHAYHFRTPERPSPPEPLRLDAR